MLDKLEIPEVFFCGLSMGGLIGQWLGIHHPRRVKKMVLSNTAAKIGNDERWNGRIETVTRHGQDAVAVETMQRWFTDGFRRRQPQKVAGIRSRRLHSAGVG